MRVEALGFRVHAFGFRDWGAGFRILRLGGSGAHGSWSRGAQRSRPLSARTPTRAPAKPTTLFPVEKDATIIRKTESTFSVKCADCAVIVNCFVQ